MCNEHKKMLKRHGFVPKVKVRYLKNLNKVNKKDSNN